MSPTEEALLSLQVLDALNLNNRGELKGQNQAIHHLVTIVGNKHLGEGRLVGGGTLILETTCINTQFYSLNGDLIWVVTIYCNQLGGKIFTSILIYKLQPFFF